MSSTSDAITGLASAIQSASLNRAPSPAHDLNPSTAASQKIPANIHRRAPSSSLSSPSSRSASISSSLLGQPTLTPHPRPLPQKTPFPPLPDFRFEQSYLASLKNADTTAKVAWVTVRDQLVLPLVQGMMWNLAVYGWRYWNGGVKFVGEGVGARVRRWWWGVNGWRIPEQGAQRGGGGEGGKGSGSIFGMAVKAEQVEEFYEDQFSTSTGD